MSKKSKDITEQKRDRTNENFAKCVKTVMKKSSKLREYRANTYLLIYRDGRFWEFNSFPSEPPSTDILVSCEVVNQRN